MQRCDNLVDLEKRCKMSIWTQKSALIQLRTSLLKFDDLAEKSEKSGMVQRKKCRARKTLKNATLDAKIGVDTAENEPRKGSEKCIL